MNSRAKCKSAEYVRGEKTDRVPLTLISEVRLDDEEEEAAPAAALSLTVDPAAAVATMRAVASPLDPLLLLWWWWLLLLLTLELLLLCKLAVAFINLVIILLTAFELLLVSR